MEEIKKLLSHRLVIVSGKGGVGKSTIAASLALCAARMGRVVLLVEWTPVEQMSKIFGTPGVGYEGGILFSGIYGLNLDPHRAFKEYMITVVHLESVYNTLFENHIIRSFRQFIPGLHDLMCLGKIYELAREKARGSQRKKYDVIIFDGPPAAQAINMLHTPSQVARIARVGPIQKHSRAITTMLHDPAHTALCIVTQAEDLSVSEAGKLVQAAFEKLHIVPGLVIANTVPSLIFSRKEYRILNNAHLPKCPPNGYHVVKAWIQYVRLMHQQAHFAQRELARIRRELSLPLIIVPSMLDGTRDIERVQSIADHMWNS